VKAIAVQRVSVSFRFAVPRNSPLAPSSLLGSFRVRDDSIHDIPFLDIKSSSLPCSGMTKSIHTPEHARLIEILREIREEAGLLQVDMAKKLGRHQSFVSKYETGERWLDLVEFKQVCKAAKISLVDFVALFEGKSQRREFGHQVRIRVQGLGVLRLLDTKLKNIKADVNDMDEPNRCQRLLDRNQKSQHENGPLTRKEKSLRARVVGAPEFCSAWTSLSARKDGPLREPGGVREYTFLAGLARHPVEVGKRDLVERRSNAPFGLTESRKAASTSRPLCTRPRDRAARAPRCISPLATGDPSMVTSGQCGRQDTVLFYPGAVPLGQDERS
jgi:transcriptional regulator with XRE-family HTH domain